ncbi:MAG: AAA family ATPase [Anaerolineales bacterium]|nr:AAA family ATPase [Anaerolineales bacterium]
MSNLADELAIYLPIDRRHALRTTSPLSQSSHGAALFADVTGFTRMTLKLIEELGNRRGAEELSSLLNAVYTAIIAEVHRFRGSVVSFSGDAITCWFEDQNGLSNASLRAVQSARLMQAGMAAFEKARLPSLAEPINVRIKVLVTSGQISRFEVGDPGLHLIDVIAGPPIDRINEASDLMKSGEVLLDRETWFRIESQAAVGGWQRNAQGVEFAPLQAIHEPASPAPWPEPEEESAPAEDLRRWLLPAVYERLRSGQGPFLAEFRKVTSMMLMFRGPDIGDPAGPDKFSRFVGWVQQVLLHYEGSLLDFNLGDKGAYISAAFGAPLSHENDSSHGLSAALALLSPPPDLEGISDVKIGLSRGWMRVGAYGSAARGTYGIHGNEINVAARLMTRAAPGEILVTDHIVRDVSSGYLFASIGSIEVKNIDRPIDVYRFTGRDSNPGLGPVGESVMIGRRGEKQQLQRLFDSFRTDRAGRTAIILGEAGSGKTMLAHDFRAAVESPDLAVIHSSADAIERRTPYFAWRAVFAAITGLNALQDPDSAREMVLRLFPADVQAEERLALLNSALPVDFPETDVTRQMTAEVRANNTIELLLSLLQLYAIRQPVALILDDIQWMDSASWRLVEALHNDRPAIFLLLAGRPDPDSQSDELHRLQSSPEVEVISLRAIAGADAAALIGHSLGCPEPSGAVVGFLEERTQGNPFFMIELALALRDAGVIAQQNGTCELTPLAEDLERLNIPDTIHGVVTSRIDRLAPPYQLVLKVASVIGRVFKFRSLHDIFPVQPEKPHLPDYLQLLDEREITPMETPPPDLSYLFKQVITQEVVYGQLLFDQRKKLHQEMAQWLERTYADDPSTVYPLMAYHWQRAENPGKAVHNLERAGALALRDFANREAVSFFSQAIELSGALDEPPSALQRAGWEMGLGEAYYGMGKIKRSQEHYRRAAALLGEPEPSSGAALGARILREMVRQEIYRRRGPRAGKSSGEREQARAYASQIYEKLSKTYYYSGEQIHGLHAVFRSVNLAESLADPDRLAEQRSRGYTSVAAGYQGALRLHSMGDYYFKQSRSIAEQSGNAGALGWSLQVKALIDGVVSGSWDSAVETNEKALAIYAELRDNRGWEETMHSQIYMRGYQGRLDLKLALAEELAAFAERQSDIQYQIYGLCHQATVLVWQDRLDEAFGCLEAIEPLLEDHQFAADRLFARGVGALANFHAGRWERSLDLAGEAAGLISEVPIGIIGLDGYAGVAETYLGVLENQPRHSAEEAMLSSIDQALDSLARTSRQYEPVRRAQILWLQGRRAWVTGNQRRAIRLWNSSLNYADRLDLVLDQARDHLLLGRHLAPGHPEKKIHLHTAEEMFAQYGAALYSEYAAQALAEAGDESLL